MKSSFNALVILIFIFLSACGRAESTMPSATLGLPTPSPFRTAVITISPTNTPQFLAIYTPAPSNAYRTALSPSGNWTANVYVPTDLENPKFTTRITYITGTPEWVLDYSLSQLEEESYYFPFHWTKDGQYLYLIIFRAIDGCGMVLEFYNGSGLFRLDLQTGAWSNVVIDKFLATYAFSISPNDTKLIYTKESTTPVTIKLRNILNEQENFLVLDEKFEGAGNFTWSPYEDKVLFIATENVCEDNQSYSILTLDLNNLEVKEVVAELNQDLSVLKWETSDIVRMRDRQGSIWILDLKSSDLTSESPTP